MSTETQTVSNLPTANASHTKLYVHCPLPTVTVHCPMSIIQVVSVFYRFLKDEGIPPYFLQQNFGYTLVICQLFTDIVLNVLVLAPWIR